MESWTEVRRRVLKRELSERASCREYEQSWHTLKKILAHQEPPGYRRKQAGRKPKREPFLPLIHEILQQAGQAPKKQRHAWAQLAADEAAAEAARATEVLSEEAIREIAVANANRDYEIAEPTAAATLAGTETDAQATLFVTCANAGVTRATAESSAAD